MIAKDLYDRLTWISDLEDNFHSMIFYAEIEGQIGKRKEEQLHVIFR